MIVGAALRGRPCVIIWYERKGGHRGPPLQLIRGGQILSLLEHGAGNCEGRDGARCFARKRFCELNRSQQICASKMPENCDQVKILGVTAIHHDHKLRLQS